MCGGGGGWGDGEFIESSVGGGGNHCVSVPSREFTEGVFQAGNSLSECSKQGIHRGSVPSRKFTK